MVIVMFRMIHVLMIHVLMICNVLIKENGINHFNLMYDNNSRVLQHNMEQCLYKVYRDRSLI